MFGLESVSRTKQSIWVRDRGTLQPREQVQFPSLLGSMAAQAFLLAGLRAVWTMKGMPLPGKHRQGPAGGNRRSEALVKQARTPSLGLTLGNNDTGKIISVSMSQASATVRKFC